MFGLLAVEAVAEQPETVAGLVLDPVVVAGEAGVVLVPAPPAPPFGGDPLGAFLAQDAVRLAAPAEALRRSINTRDRADIRAWRRSITCRTSVTARTC